jgi:hypothetical protein
MTHVRHTVVTHSTICCQPGSDSVVAWCTNTQHKTCHCTLSAKPSVTISLCQFVAARHYHGVPCVPGTENLCTLLLAKRGMQVLLVQLGWVKDHASIKHTAQHDSYNTLDKTNLSQLIPNIVALQNDAHNTQAAGVSAA